MGAAEVVPALILAAGRSIRMGSNKLLADVDGRPMIRHAVEAALMSAAAPVFVVVGHQAERVTAALAGLGVPFVDNPDFAEGMAASLRHGVAALPMPATAVLVALGDMPLVRSHHYDRLIEAFAVRPDAMAVLPTFAGRRGHPVLLARALFPRIMALGGDEGARRLLGQGVVEVPVADDGVLRDADTPESLATLRS